MISSAPLLTSTLFSCKMSSASFSCTSAVSVLLFRKSVGRMDLILCWTDTGYVLVCLFVISLVGSHAITCCSEQWYFNRWNCGSGRHLDYPIIRCFIKAYAAIFVLLFL